MKKASRLILGTPWGRAFTLYPLLIMWVGANIANALWVIRWGLFLTMGMIIFASMLVTANMERAEVTSHE